jgi:hypothetical protein
VESAVLRDEIEATPIHQPIYITGVPRSGTTVLTELIASHPQVTSHRYSDFPNVHTPYWRNWLADRSRRPPARPVERAHRDRIRVTTESPEAVEEVLWREFFPRLRNRSGDQWLDADTRNPAFERFYRDHIRKLLLVRSCSRYLAKGNYNLTRMGYLHSLFPDARFIVPIRNPIDQVASLIKQDRLFRRLADEDPRVPGQLHRSGHDEFGPGRRSVLLDGDDRTRQIDKLWDEGRDVEAWAWYWTTLYQHLLDRIENDPGLADAVLVLRYEDLCRSPAPTVSDALDHLDLDASGFGPAFDDAVASISAPAYYEPDLSTADRATLIEITATVAGSFGYIDLR